MIQTGSFWAHLISVTLDARGFPVVKYDLLPADFPDPNLECDYLFIYLFFGMPRT